MVYRIEVGLCTQFNEVWTYVCSIENLLNRPCNYYLGASMLSFSENCTIECIDCLNSVRKSCSGFLKVKANLIARTHIHIHTTTIATKCVLNCVLFKRNVVYSIYPIPDWYLIIISAVVHICSGIACIIMSHMDWNDDVFEMHTPYTDPIHIEIVRLSDVMTNHWIYIQRWNEMIQFAIVV